MKRQQAEAILDRFFEECGDAVPAQSDIEPALDRIWGRLEWRGDEYVAARIPAAPARPIRFVWVVALVVIAVSVNVVVWRQGPPFPVAVKSGNADEHSLSKLSTEQAAETSPLTVPTDVFELVSVKKLSPEAAKTATTRESMQLALTGCVGGDIGSARLDPGRLTLPGITVLTLVMVAYGQECALVERGPAWARSGEFYEIQALLPEGTPRYTREDLQKGNAPRLQGMIQNLLVDRFRLVLRRESREMPVYLLTVANPGKMKLSPDETLPGPASWPVPPGMPAIKIGRGQMLRGVGPTETQMSGHAISMSALAKDLTQYAGRVVIDKTGVNELFDVDLKFARDVPSLVPPSPPPAPPQSIPPVPGPPAVSAPSLQSAIEDLGLKLESARMPVEFLVIQSVERPSEN